MTEPKTKKKTDDLPELPEVWGEWSVSNGTPDSVVIPERRFKLVGADGHELIVVIRSMSKVEKAKIAATLYKAGAYPQFAGLLTPDSYTEFIEWSALPEVAFDPDTLWVFNVRWASGEASAPFVTPASTD